MTARWKLRTMWWWGRLSPDTSGDLTTVTRQLYFQLSSFQPGVAFPCVLCILATQLPWPVVWLRHLGVSGGSRGSFLVKAQKLDAWLE